MKESFQDVLHFWFNEIDPNLWWQKSIEFDETIKHRFLASHTAARFGELSDWRSSARGRLAEILMLDQFSRNIFRDQPEAFAQDAMALTLSQELIRGGYDRELSATEKCFAYLPYMHSESALIHEEAVRLFSQPGLEAQLDFELKHKIIIDRFNRYPHRNKSLGRISTPEEIEFLKEPNSSF